METPTLPEVVATYPAAGMDDYVLHVAVATAEALRDFVLAHLTTDPVADVHAYYDAAARLNAGGPLYLTGVDTNEPRLYQHPPLPATASSRRCRR